MTSWRGDTYSPFGRANKWLSDRWNDTVTNPDHWKNVGGSLASWTLNHSPARALHGEWDWDSPESMNRWSQAEIFGIGPAKFAQSRYQEMKDNELDKWKTEVAQYYGVGPEDIAYPFRAGMVSGFGGYGPAISDAVRDLYNVNLRMWK